jgi:hypothetical protein
MSWTPKAMQQEQNYPILEFDNTPEAIIEPKQPCFCTGKTLLARCRSLSVVVTTPQQLWHANLDASKDY